TAAVRGSSVLAARRATGWPPTRWFSRVRADPLRALHLPSLGGPVTARRRDGEQGTGSTAARPGPDDESVARTSLRPAGAAEAARARGAVRTYLDAATDGAPAPWVLAARSAVRDDTLGDALDRAVAGAPLLPRRRPRWWGIVGGVQWLLLGVLVVGLVWLGALAGLDALRLPVPTTPEWGTGPVPTVAAVGGAAAGLLVAGLARLAAHVGARRHARRATVALRSAVEAVAERVVTAPVADVMDRLALCRTSAQLAAGPARRTTPRGAR
ncbi:MAG: GTP-binding protein HSR1, partial [Cellulomonadaceae bacterium]|nr:GTP-binding protein HSR1 [Cellulomonadaceae bacterium]